MAGCQRGRKCFSAYSGTGMVNEGREHVPAQPRLGDGVQDRGRLEHTICQRLPDERAERRPLGAHEVDVSVPSCLPCAAKVVIGGGAMPGGELGCGERRAEAGAVVLATRSWEELVELVQRIDKGSSSCFGCTAGGQYRRHVDGGPCAIEERAGRSPRQLVGGARRRRSQRLQQASRHMHGMSAAMTIVFLR